MAQIGTLAAAPAVTIIQGQANCDQYIVIGEVGTELPLSSLTVEVDGKPFILIQNAALISAFSKWQMEVDAIEGVIGSMIKIATGQIKKNTTYRFVNSGATTPGIFAFSDSPNGVPLEVAGMQINATSNETFERFSALFLTAAGDITSLQIEFTSGHTDTLTFQEAAGYFNMKFSADSNGLLGEAVPVLVIDNTDWSIKSVRVNTGANPVDTLTVRIPDAAFAQFQKAIK